MNYFGRDLGSGVSSTLMEPNIGTARRMRGSHQIFQPEKALLYSERLVFPVDELPLIGGVVDVGLATNRTL